MIVLPAQLLVGVALPLGAQGSPAGLWNTISDVDGRPTAVVELREDKGEYVGVVRALLVPADHEDSICGKCSDERRNQPVVGMEILRHMRPDGAEWSGGEILDPENGKTYRARMKLTDGGKKLVIRGYIGVPLFGRSQTWVRRADQTPTRTSSRCASPSSRCATSSASRGRAPGPRR
jgi:uncharacterized protein (DUF2147 family)